MYLADPAPLYQLGDIRPYPFSPVAGAVEAYQIDQTTFARALERAMLGGSGYDHARLGVEIAYTIAEENFGLKDVVIREPSQGGPDLITADGKVVIQARLIKDFTQFNNPNIPAVIDDQVAGMVNQVKWDFKNNGNAHMGLVIFSYLDGNNLTTLVVEVEP
jgi:hypothetical protein